MKNDEILLWRRRKLLTNYPGIWIQAFQIINFPSVITSHKLQEFQKTNFGFELSKFQIESAKSKSKSKNSSARIQLRSDNFTIQLQISTFLQHRFQQLRGGRSEDLPEAAPEFLKNLLPKKKNPRQWPPIATKNTPTLNDITASITKYANPTLTVCIRVRINPAATELESSLINRLCESHSTTKASTKMKIKAKAYIPERSPGQLRNRISALVPQKKVMCIIRWCIVIPDDAAEEAGGGSIPCIWWWWVSSVASMATPVTENRVWYQRVRLVSDNW